MSRFALAVDSNDMLRKSSVQLCQGTDMQCTGGGFAWQGAVLAMDCRAGLWL